MFRNTTKGIQRDKWFGAHVEIDRNTFGKVGGRVYKFTSQNSHKVLKTFHFKKQSEQKNWESNNTKPVNY